MRKVDLTKYNWDYIQKEHDNGLYWSNIPKKFGFSIKTLERAGKEGFINKKLHKRETSDETRKKISEGRKKFLKENPDKHPWKRHDKFKSEPCERFKKMLKVNNISFLEEYEPLEENSYAIDVAFPDKKIGIEINGNQHYNEDGTLKSYYKKRKKEIEEKGWKLFDIHYSLIYKKGFIDNIIKDIKNKYNLKIIDYTFYVKESIKRKNKKYYCSCGKEKYYKSKKCIKCQQISRRKVKRPPYEQLIKEIKETNHCAVGRKYGVSDTAIRKWIKQYEINK